MYTRVLRAGAGPWWSRSRLPLPLIIVLTLLAGCASSSGVRGEQSPPKRAPAPSPTATAEPTPNPTPVTLREAWSNVAITQLPTAQPDNRALIFKEAATPDGQWLVVENSPRDFSLGTIRPSFAQLYNVRTRQLVTMHQLPSPQSQMLSASVDDHWVVWSEAVGQNFNAWSIFTYNRQTGEVRQLATAPLINGQPVPAPSAVPMVDHGIAIWSEALGPIGPDTLDNAVVRMEDLATGAVTTLATRAAAPTFVWPWVLWGQATGGQDGYVAAKNLETGQALQLQLANAVSIAIAGSSLAYDDQASIYLLDDFTHDTSHPRELLTSGRDDYLEFVTLNDRLLGWYSQAITEVYDRAEQRFVSLPISHGTSQTWVGGRLLTWETWEEDSRPLLPTPTINVIDTTTLPVRHP